MPIVSNALQALAGTMRHRGGVSDAMLRAADANLGLRKMEFDIGQSTKAGQRAERALGLQEETFGLQKQAAEEQRVMNAPALSEAKRSMEEVEIPASMFIPKNDKSGAIHIFTPGKDGSSIWDRMNKGLPGSGWDDKTGTRIDSNGKPVKIPRWQLEKLYAPAAMAEYMSQIDPVKKLHDQIWEAEEGLKELDEKSGEYADRKKQVDGLKATLSDRDKLAGVYARKASLIGDAVAWGVQNNVRKDFLEDMKTSLQATMAKFEQYSARMTPEQKAKYDADLAKIKAETDKAIAETGKIKVETAAGGKGALTAKNLGDWKKEAIKLTDGAMDALKNPITGKIEFNGKELSGEEVLALRDKLTDQYFKQISESAGYGLSGGKPAGGEQNKVLSGAPAKKRAGELIKMIDSGSVNTEQLLEILARSGQNEVGRIIIQHIKSKGISGPEGGTKTPVEIQPGSQRTKGVTGPGGELVEPIPVLPEIPAQGISGAQLNIDALGRSLGEVGDMGLRAVEPVGRTAQSILEEQKRQREKTLRGATMPYGFR